MHNTYVVTEYVDWCSPIKTFATLQINRNECACLRYLQGVVTLHISIVQATWAAARPSGSMKILSSPVTKSHITPCKQTRDPFPKQIPFMFKITQSRTASPDSAGVKNDLVFWWNLINVCSKTVDDSGALNTYSSVAFLKYLMG